MAAEITRRKFLATTATTAAAIAAASEVSAFAPQPEPIRVGLIGCGGIMSSHVRRIVARGLPVEFTHLCDVDDHQPERRGIAKAISGFQKQAPKRTRNFEEVLEDKTVQAVIVATPHHQHAPIALPAMQAGKDIYLEKPGSHVFSEGPLYIAAAKKYNVVFQHGSQMRSSPVTESAGELLASGIIGEVKMTKAWNCQNREVRKPVADAQPPAGVDYDRWLGPAPERPFNENRFHQYWRVFRDYGNGDIGDDGIHDIDMARWGLGVTQHPNRITAHGSTIAKQGDRDYPDNMMVAFHYDDGKVLLYEDRLFTPYGYRGFDSGNTFYGTEGYMIFSRRGYYQVYLGAKEKEGPTVPREIRGGAGRGYDEHMDNFLKCVRTRETASCTPEIAHLSCSLVHLGEIAFRAQDVINFDPATETIQDNPSAAKLLTKTYRAPYGLPTDL